MNCSLNHDEVKFSKYADEMDPDLSFILNDIFFMKVCEIVAHFGIRFRNCADCLALEAEVLVLHTPYNSVLKTLQNEAV